MIEKVLQKVPSLALCGELHNLVPAVLYQVISYCNALEPYGGKLVFNGACHHFLLEEGHDIIGQQDEAEGRFGCTDALHGEAVHAVVVLEFLDPVLTVALRL